MGFFQWIGHNWFEATQTFGILAGTAFTLRMIVADAKARRLEHRMTLTERHYEIWNELNHSPDLARVLKPHVNTKRSPVTLREKLFVRALILHLQNVFAALQDGMLNEPEALEWDIRGFFTLPVPAAVWEQVKMFQDQDFLQFVTEALQSEDRVRSEKKRETAVAS